MILPEWRDHTRRYRRTARLDAYGNALQRSTTMAYDAVSNLLSLTNPLGVVTSYNYDALNRRVNVLDAYGTALQRTTTAVYDLDDRVSASIDALGFATTYNYDALNRQVSVQDAGGGVATTAYDPADRVVNSIDPMGNVTTYNYDALNRRTQTTDARGGVTTLSYDANDNQLSLVDPVSNRTWWLYDALDRKVQETDPLGNSGTFAYDIGDRMSSATDRLGQRIGYNYDLLNRETGEAWFNTGGTQVSTLTFTYDGNDNLLTAEQGGGSLMTPTYYANTMAYDALDRLSSMQAPFGSVLTYGYDAADNRTLTQDSFGGTTTRTYDALNRMTTLQYGGSGLTPLREDLGYTARDQVATQTRFSDLAGTTRIGSSTLTYDAVGRLTNMQHFNGAGSVLANTTNTYDLASRITAEVLNGGAATSYSYDKTDELTNDGVVTYSYDLNGNRTMAGYATGPANEMTSDGTWAYFYEANGNLIQRTDSSTGEVWSYAYDNRNRLVAAQDVTSGVQMQATYVYDPQGKRIEKDVWTGSGTRTTRFASDGDEIWADLTSANALQERYLRGERVLDLLAWQSAGGVTSWPLADRMGSVRTVVDGTGALIDTITYDGYGNITNETSAASGGNYKAFGYRVDGETGWLRPDPSTGRHYNSLLGRWVARDPVQFQASDTNLYRYVLNNPVAFTDPEGLVRGGGRYRDCKDCWKEVGVEFNVLFGSKAWNTPAIVEADLADAQAIYEQCCIDIVRVGSVKWNQGKTVAALGRRRQIIPWFARGKAALGTATAEERALTQGQTTKVTVYVYYVEDIFELRRETLAYSFWPGVWTSPPAPAIIMSDLAQGNGYIFSHELGHILNGSGAHVDLGAMGPASEPNLMAEKPGLGRILVSRQCDRMRSNPLVRWELFPPELNGLR